MSRLIDADALLVRWRAAMLHMVKDEFGKHPISLETLIKDVDNAPTIDAVPVVHGRWLHNDEYVLWAEKYVCSVCNCNAPSDGDYRPNLTNYCPNCGAKMDLEVDGDG